MPKLDPDRPQPGQPTDGQPRQGDFVPGGGAPAPTGGTKTTTRGGGKGGGRSRGGGGGGRGGGYDVSQQYASLYFGLWGSAPPAGYVERAIRSGMNIHEFEANERAKAGFRNSPRYKEDALSVRIALRDFIGYPPVLNVDRFVDAAVRSGRADPERYAFALITASPDFRSRFPGIFRPDGSMRVSPTEYLDREERYASTAAKYGFKLTRLLIGAAVGNNVDPEEFESRAKAVQTYKTQPGLVEFLNNQIRDRNAVRVSSGLPAIRPIGNEADAVNFFMGRSDDEVYDLFEASAFATAAKEAGIADFTSRQGRELASRTAGALDFEKIEEGFINIATQLRTAQSDLAQFGLDEDDLAIIEFGGPGRAGKALRAAQAINQARARAQAPAAVTELDLSVAGRLRTAGRQEQGL